VSTRKNARKWQTLQVETHRIRCPFSVSFYSQTMSSHAVIIFSRGISIASGRPIARPLSIIVDGTWSGPQHRDTMAIAFGSASVTALKAARISDRHVEVHRARHGELHRVCVKRWNRLRLNANLEYGLNWV